MANESDDECDLDTLSALLEEDNSNDSTSQGKNAAEDASSVAGSKAGGAAQGDGDELDEEALASLLEHDSDLDDWSTQEEKSQNDCTANDIAAFFNKKSDSESETEDSQEGKLVMAMGEETSQASESEGQEVTTEETSASRSHCPPESSGQDVSSQGEPGHVTNLQDELAMMQKRMMEIQQLIASQSQSAATTASSQPAKTCVTAGKSQRHSSSTLPKASSSQRSSKSAEDKGKHLKKNNGTSSSKAASSNGLSSLSSSSKSSKLNSNSSIHATSKEQSSETTSSSIRSHSKEIAHRSRKPAHETSKSSYKSEKHKTSRHSDVAEKRGTSSSHKNSPAPTLRQSGTTNSPASTLRQSGTTNSPASTLRQSGTTNSPASTLRQSGTTNSPASTLRQSGTTNNSNKTHFRDSDTGSKSAWQEERSVKKHISPETKNGSHSAKKESQQGESSKTSAFLNDVASREEKEQGSRKEMKHALTDIASRGEKKEENRKDMKRTLFGDGDSDSDWDDLEGAGDQGNLSSAGRDIKRLMRTGERQRQAHTPSYPLPASAPLSTSWKPKPQVSNSALSESRPSTHHSASKPAIKREAEDKDCMTEKHTGLRVKNPKISSIMLGSKMEGRRMIPLSKLHLKVKSPDLQSDWVTIGVIVKKSDSRKSQTGKTFSIWTLSDLQDSDTTVSFFLFGQVYKQLWKTGAGTVIGLLNPSIMDSMEKNPGEVAFTINNAAQLMDVGQSRDLGWCIGKTKRGATCTNFINKKFGDFCTYHVQTAYRKQSAKRSELHGSCPGTTPKSSLKSKIFGGDTFFYGGETFISSKGKGCGGGKKDTVTLGKLQAQATQQDQRKVSTLSIQGLVPADQVKVETKMASQHEQPFIKMLAVPSPGSMNLVKHMAKQEGCNEDGTDTNGTGKSFQSVQAIDLLKQHRQEIAQRLSQRKQQAAEAQRSKAQSATATQSDGKFY
ncbi:hypothetical protein V1264_021020 [Littorina saxatilis]|uniref:Protein MCM10 homolog n=1 Tax=Littorina saxatilis TaxID=31220 RepID=A0AAN9BBD7_9CAEN